MSHIDNLVAMQLCPACGTVAVETPLFHLQTYMRCNNCKDDIANLKASHKATIKTQKYNVGDVLSFKGAFINPQYFTMYNSYPVQKCGNEGCNMIINDVGNECHLDDAELDQLFNIRFRADEVNTAPTIITIPTSVNFWTLP